MTEEQREKWRAWDRRRRERLSPEERKARDTRSPAAKERKAMKRQERYRDSSAEQKAARAVKELARRKAKTPAAQEAERAKRRSDRLKAKYGLTTEEYIVKLETQGGVCAICRRVSRKPLDVDHCHRTGAVRGLLCGPCNNGIGKLSDDPDRLRSAISYLESYLVVEAHSDTAPRMPPKLPRPSLPRN
jgi:hypothetical protein